MFDISVSFFILVTLIFDISTSLFFFIIVTLILDISASFYLLVTPSSTLIYIIDLDLWRF